MGKIALIIVGIIVVVALAIGGWAVGNYNTLVSKRNEVDKQWSQVENNLKRRADLIGFLGRRCGLRCEDGPSFQDDRVRPAA